jgi:phosphate transport system substrate-binding protein
MSRIILATCLVLSATAVSAQSIKGAGSSFAFDLYQVWSEQYLRKQGRTLEYEPVGSSSGVKAIVDKTVDFGASDRPLTRDELQKHGLAQFPTAIGGVVLIASLPGVRSDMIVLDGATVADIYLGRIKKWNDPKLVALNPNLKLPDSAIIPVFRSDGSGTSYAFTSYLAKTSPEWKQAIGATSQLTVTGGRGLKGNKAIAENVQATAGTLGYVEFSYAEDLKLPTIRLKNKFGDTVSATPDAFQQAMRAADWEIMMISPDPTFELDLIDVGCPRCWPISSPTYVLVPVRPKNPATSIRVLDFFQQALNEGDQLATSESYVPLPSRAKNLVKVSMRRWYLALGAK